ncbi:MAG: DUF1365 domain-containing protein [Pseudonocardia sp.]|nr:DUF1365 domain-containing protein [Pseudonocardia sp.]
MSGPAGHPRAGTAPGTTSVRTPSLYDARVRHTRRRAQDHGFAHDVYFWLVDLDDLPRFPRLLRPLARFEARDHLGDPDSTIRQNLDAYLATQGVDLAGGRVLMLANARTLGHVVNPISVFWCHRADATLECVVAEVHNTYGERHCYLLRPDDAGRAVVDKDFYVSPFLSVDGQYAMSVPEPGERLALAVTLRQEGTAALTATVAGTRTTATTRGLLRTILRHPFVTHRTSALIRRHGITLWLRGLPVVPRPKHRPQEGVQ